MLVAPFMHAPHAARALSLILMTAGSARWDRRKAFWDDAMER